MKVYKLRNTKTGIFYGPGGRTSKTGKVWMRLDHLHRHLACARYHPERMRDMEIREVQTTPLLEFFR